MTPGLFVYVRHTKKVGLLIDVQMTSQLQEAPMGMNAEGVLVPGGPPREVMVPVATVAFKDTWWLGPLGDTTPVWEDTEVDTIGPIAPELEETDGSAGDTQEPEVDERDPDIDLPTG